MADLTIPFQARGERGTLRIAYSLNGNPDRWGFDILGLDGDVSRAAAFPVFDAAVTYAREGYAAIFGWIQVVHYWAGASTPEWSLLDVAPQLRGFGIPFFSWGVTPRCFDAPLDTPDGIARWQAVTFLMQTPDGLMSRNVEPLLGVTRGYSIADGMPTVNDVEHAGQAEWDRLKPTLTRDCPQWTFAETFSEA